MRAQKKPVASSSPSSATARLEKVRLVVPPGERKEAEILGHGPDAAPRVVEVLQRIGVA
jgi:electron transfer flavoprotein beta subunit